MTLVLSARAAARHRGATKSPGERSFHFRCAFPLLRTGIIKKSDQLPQRFFRFLFNHSRSTNATANFTNVRGCAAAGSRCLILSSLCRLGIVSPCAKSAIVYQWMTLLHTLYTSSILRIYQPFPSSTSNGISNEDCYTKVLGSAVA